MLIVCLTHMNWLIANWAIEFCFCDFLFGMIPGQITVGSVDFVPFVPCKVWIFDSQLIRPERLSFANAITSAWIVFVLFVLPRKFHVPVDLIEAVSRALHFVAKGREMLQWFHVSTIEMCLNGCQHRSVLGSSG